MRRNVFVKKRLVLLLYFSVSSFVSSAVAQDAGPPLPKVVGVVCESQSAENNHVILESPSSGEQDLFATGAQAFGRFLVKEISKEYVLIASHNELFRLPISGGTAQKVANAKDLAPRKQTQDAPKQSTGAKLKVMYLPGSKTIEEIRKLVDQTTTSPNGDNVIVTNNYESYLKSGFMKAASRSPQDLVGTSRAFAPIQDLQGTILGLRISDSKAAGLLSAFGFRDGDILLEVNLHPVHSYESLCEALKDTSQGRVLFDYLRDNRRFSYAVNTY